MIPHIIETGRLLYAVDKETRFKIICQTIAYIPSIANEIPKYKMKLKDINDSKAAILLNTPESE